MKTESNYRPTEDLSNLKVGDRVYSLTFGWGTVLSKYNKPDAYHIECEFDSGRDYCFLGGGGYSRREAAQDLFTYNPFEPKSEYPKLMEVSDDKVTWRKHVVVAEHDGRFITTKVAPRAWNSFDWKYAREIQPETESKPIDLTSLDAAIENLQNLRKSLTK